MPKDMVVSFREIMCPQGTSRLTYLVKNFIIGIGLWKDMEYFCIILILKCSIREMKEKFSYLLEDSLEQTF